MKYLLDTNVCIALINGGDRSVGARVLALTPGEIGLCSAVKAELIYGARRSQRVADNLARLRTFFRSFESLPFDDVAAEHYGVIRAQLESLGTPIGGNDLIIAATALAADVVLVTRNEREFRRVPALAVEVW